MLAYCCDASQGHLRHVARMRCTAGNRQCRLLAGSLLPWRLNGRRRAIKLVRFQGAACAVSLVATSNTAVLKGVPTARPAAQPPTGSAASTTSQPSAVHITQPGAAMASSTTSQPVTSAAASEPATAAIIDAAARLPLGTACCHASRVPATSLSATQRASPQEYSGIKAPSLGAAVAKHRHSTAATSFPALASADPTLLPSSSHGAERRPSPAAC